MLCVCVCVCVRVCVGGMDRMSAWAMWYRLGMVNRHVSLSINVYRYQVISLVLTSPIYTQSPLTDEVLLPNSSDWVPLEVHATGAMPAARVGGWVGGW